MRPGIRAAFPMTAGRPGPPKKSVPPAPDSPLLPSRPQLSPLRWRWLSAAVLAVAFLAFMIVRPGAGGTPVQVLSYTSLVSDVTANKVSTAAITAAGSVSGKLSDGGAYTSQIPVALDDSALPALLLGHKVQVTGTSASPSPWLGLLGWIVPFLLIVGFFVWMGRRASKQFPGRMGAIMGFGKSKAKVYDEDRPSTHFADIAGYEAPRPRSWKSWTS